MSVPYSQAGGDLRFCAVGQMCSCVHLQGKRQMNYAVVWRIVCGLACCEMGTRLLCCLISCHPRAQGFMHANSTTHAALRQHSIRSLARKSGAALTHSSLCMRTGEALECVPPPPHLLESDRLLRLSPFGC